MTDKRRAKPATEPPPYTGGKLRDYLFTVAQDYRDRRLTDGAMMGAIDTVIMRCVEDKPEESLVITRCAAEIARLETALEYAVRLLEEQRQAAKEGKGE